jgi:parvulin-like peptidyl-prolyl isomerase
MPIVNRINGLCLALALLFFLNLTCAGKPVWAADTPLASVNGITISSKELEWEVKQLAVEMRFRNQPLSEQQLTHLRGQLIENLIEREMLFQHAQAKEIQIQSQWVEAALTEFKEQLGGPTALQRFLTEADMTPAQLKTRLAKGLTVQRLLRRDPIRPVKVSDAEMQAFYRNHPELFQGGEAVRVKHILVAVSDMNDDSQRAQGLEKIRSLKKKLDQGANFAALALEYSDCPSRIRSGDLGYLSRDQMIASFAAAAFELQPGTINDIVETRYGFHLIQLMDRRGPSLLAYKEVRDKIERTLRRDKENDAVSSYVNGLKRQSKIERYSARN